jgi:hypothetical protein
MYHSRLQVICNPDFTEILMAEIADAGFDTFLETDNGFEAYVEMEKYDKDQLRRLFSIRTKFKKGTGMRNGRKVMSPLSLRTNV